MMGLSVHLSLKYFAFEVLICMAHCLIPGSIFVGLLIALHPCETYNFMALQETVKGVVTVDTLKDFSHYGIRMTVI